MTISRNVKKYGRPGLARHGRHDTFAAHDKRMKRFRRKHGGIAGVEAAIMMRLSHHVSLPDRDYGGSTGFADEKDLPGLMVMKRPPRRILSGN